MEAIEKENPPLKDVLPRVYARGNLDPTNMGGLIDLIANIALGAEINCGPMRSSSLTRETRAI